MVGGGPTGIAALFQAHLEGIPAVGLEAGPAPVATVRDYLDGVVLISRPTDYEVAGIPLDCRDPNQLTREEVLHYLGRIINYGGLTIHCGQPASALRRVDGGVEVVTPAGTWLARNVIVTAWYRKAPLPAGLVGGGPGGGGVEVIESLHDGAQVAGRRVVVFGGGLSAFEQATAVMLHGQAVTMIARHSLPVTFRTPHFQTLLADTGSRVVEGAADLRLTPDGLAYALRGEESLAPCDVVVAALGQEMDPAVLAMLSSAGVVSGAEVSHIRAAATPDTMIRHGSTVPEAINAALGSWPDLRTRLLGGVGGIRLVGGGLHIGGAHSGVKVSIHTAVVAVRDVAGHPPPQHLAAPMAGQREVPLPMALARYVQLPPQEAIPSLLGPLRPLRIASWTRTTMAMRSRDSFEARPQPIEQSPYLLVPQPDEPLMAAILAMADGSHSVAEIAASLGAGAADPLRRVARPLRFLWQNNALTWLPPKPPAR